MSKPVPQNSIYLIVGSVAKASKLLIDGDSVRLNVPEGYSAFYGTGDKAPRVYPDSHNSVIARTDDIISLQKTGDANSVVTVRKARSHLPKVKGPPRKLNGYQLYMREQTAKKISGSITVPQDKNPMGYFASLWKDLSQADKDDYNTRAAALEPPTDAPAAPAAAPAQSSHTDSTPRKRSAPAAASTPAPSAPASAGGASKTPRAPRADKHADGSAKSPPQSRSRSDGSKPHSTDRSSSKPAGSAPAPSSAPKSHDKPSSTPKDSSNATKDNQTKERAPRAPRSDKRKDAASAATTSTSTSEKPKETPSKRPRDAADGGSARDSKEKRVRVQS